MKLRWIVPLASACAIVVAACSSKSTTGDGATSSTPTPTPTPTGTPSLGFTFTGVHFEVHNGKYGSVRVLEGTNVLFCSSTLIPSAPSTTNFTISAPGPILTPGHSYSVEFFADLNVANGLYNDDATDTDHNWALPITNATTNVNMSFVHFSVGEIPITWVDGTGCPGT